jgi:VIT1/CCC1 family predicted Fe2+/Mn2+ transporter
VPLPGNPGITPAPETSEPGTARLAIFGGVDGLTMFLGLVLGIIVSRQPGTAAWHAALGGAAGELVGMTSGQYISDRAAGLSAALACGVAGAVACALPGVPFVFLPRTDALGVALVTAVLIAAIITWMRPEKGLAAVAQTYGVLIAAGILAGLTGLI